MKLITKNGSIERPITITNAKQKFLFVGLKLDFLLLGSPSTSISKLPGNISWSDDFIV